MDFNDLLSIARKNEQTSKKEKYHGYSTDLPAPKKEKRDKKRSEVVQKLMDGNRQETEKAMSNGGSNTNAQQNEKEQKDCRIPKKTKIENLMKDLGSDDDSDNISGSEKSSSVILDKGSDSDKRRDKQESYYKHERHKLDSNDNKVEKHKSHSGSSNDKQSHSSTNSSSNNSNDKHSSDKHSRDKHSSDKHSRDKHTGDKHSRDKHSSEKYSSEKTSSDKHKHSSNRQSSDKDFRDKNSSERHSSDKHSIKTFSSDKHSKDKSAEKPSKPSDRHSEHKTHSSSTDKHLASSSKKVKAPTELSLEELRKQVFSMKEQAQQLEKQEVSLKKTEERPVIPLEKHRQGVADTDADKKALILAMMQEKKERMKAKLEEEKAAIKPQRERGKRSGDKERVTDKMGNKVKSKSMVKDDDDSDDDTPGGAMDMSFSSDLLNSGSVDMKSIKKKIDEKLSNYNFEDKPEKEKKSAKRSPINKKDQHKQRLSQHKDKHRKTLPGSAQRQPKAEKMKSLMRNDYKANFSGNDPEEQRKKKKVKKPVIIRRAQCQPPPPKFEDLLKLASQKSKEVPINQPLKPMKPKKVEERPMTQEEIERKKRAEDHRKRSEEEQGGIRKPAKQEITQASKSDSCLLKSALLGKSGTHGTGVKGIQASSKKSSGLGNVQKPSNSGKKYDVESERVIVCGGAGPGKKAVKEEPGLNPFDRIVSQFKKTNPKPEKRKREEPMYSDEDYDEEDEYDEDDDFIDDGGDPADVSAHIRDIFGYDKRKYRFEDSDDDNMEANFTTIMKEEARSAKIGRMEDLEDIRREEEELKRKMKVKKMRR